MILVALVALTIGSELTRQRWVHFRERARFFASAEEFDRFLLDGGMATIQLINGPVSQIHGPITIREESVGGGSVETTMEGSPGYDADSLRRRSEYHRRLRRKYERAARYPWLPVAPDPPEPK
jgi:hypothetical protein